MKIIIVSCTLIWRPVTLSHVLVKLSCFIFRTMVKLHIKKGDESQFMYETTVEMPVADLLKDVSAIYNGRLKIQRICSGMMPGNISLPEFSSKSIINQGIQEKNRIINQQRVGLSECVYNRRPVTVFEISLPRPATEMSLI